MDYEPENVEDPYDTDEMSDYIPETDSESDASRESKGESHAGESEEKPHSSNLNNVLSNTSTNHITPKRSRKRQRHVVNWKKNQIKEKRLKGEEYISRGKVRSKREVKQYIHTCRSECSQFSKEDRERLFTKLYSLPTYDLQTSFLASCVKKTSPARGKPGGRKTYTTVITLMNRRVCREFFLKTFDISDSRFKVVCKKLDKDGFVETNKRGHHVPKNKVSEASRNFVLTHINMFPRYKSHYSRHHNPNTRYLSPDLNIRKLYKLYVDICKEQERVPVRESYYRTIFNSEFNLRFHKPHSDTCHKCDYCNNMINNTSNNENVINKLKMDLELHQRKAQKAVDAKLRDIGENRTSNDTVVICFDLQKTLPTPLLTTNKVFYLRQLWTYNFCVRNLLTGKSHMYIWDECTASRGSQEIGSCLLKFVESLPTTAKKIIAYSDSCGGQNKNKNITKLFIHIVKSTQIEQIDHKFFEPGHSYMECDRDFGLIEKNKRKNPQVFVPDHWCDIIKKSSRNFQIHRMNQNDFFSFDALHEVMKDVKKDTQNKPLKWRGIQWFRYKKEEPFVFEFKETLDTSFEFYKTQKCNKAGRPSSTNITLRQLHTEFLKIKFEKWENLQQLLQFIPPIYSDFFKNLPHTEKSGKTNKKKSKNINQPEGDVQPTVDDDGTEELDDMLESDYE